MHDDKQADQKVARLKGRNRPGIWHALKAVIDQEHAGSVRVRTRNETLGPRLSFIGIYSIGKRFSRAMIEGSTLLTKKGLILRLLATYHIPCWGGCRLSKYVLGPARRN